jgi:hypothetical protein
MKRAPAIRNGGIVSTAYRIARYVEPHTTYTAANAAMMRDREDIGAVAVASIVVISDLSL